MSNLSEQFFSTANFRSEPLTLKDIRLTIRELSADQLIKLVGGGDFKKLDTQALDIIPKLVIESVYDAEGKAKIFEKADKDRILPSMSVGDLTAFVDAFNSVNGLGPKNLTEIP